MPDSILPSSPNPPPSMLPFGLKSLPNPTVLTVIFGVLLISAIGMGTAVVMSGNTQPPPVEVPTPTPTPDPTSSWRDYTSEVYGLSLKVPKEWRIQEGGGVGDNSLYFHADEVVKNNRFYVYVTFLPNPDGLSLQQALSDYYATDVPFMEEQLGENILFMSTRVPSRQGALSAFLPRGVDSDYLTLSLTPYDNNQPLPEQKRYETIFRQMLSTVTLFQPASSAAIPTLSPSEEDANTPTFWKTYADPTYPFSFEYPPEYVLDTSRQGKILLSDNFEVIVTPVDPSRCTGVCPVRERSTTVKVGEYSARKHEGYLTSEGGMVPQRYLQYVFNNNNQYYMFTLYEVGLNSNLPKDRTPGPIPLEDIQDLEQIISSLRFRR